MLELLDLIPELTLNLMISFYTTPLREDGGNQPKLKNGILNQLLELDFLKALV